MTLSELTSEVMSRLNLSSSDASTRISSFINLRYRRLTSSLGLNTTRRASQSINTVAGTATITYTSLEKVDIVYSLVSGKRKIINQVPYEEYRIKSTEAPREGLPWEYAVQSVTPSTVTIALYPTPDDVYAITADGLSNLTTLTSGDTPVIPTDFQDVLILGAMADELFKMEKFELSAEKERQYEMRASDLRMFLAKSAYISAAEADSPGSLYVAIRKRWR